MNILGKLLNGSTIFGKTSILGVRQDHEYIVENIGHAATAKLNLILRKLTTCIFPGFLVIKENIHTSSGNSRATKELQLDT